MKKLFFVFGFLSLVLNAQNQKDTSKLHHWMLKHQFTVSAGYFRAHFKKQDLLVVQPKYNRSLRFFDVEANDLTYFENISSFQFTATQHRVNFSANFKYNFQLALNISHLNYGANTNKYYRAQGTWDNQHVNDTLLMNQYVKALFHTNGLNFWNASVKKIIPIFNKKKNFKVFGNLGVHSGVCFTSSEIEIKDTVANKFLFYTPGNKIAGYNIGVNSSLDIVFFKHYVLQPFWDWSFAYLHKAPFEDGYVRQKIYANYYGINVGYRF